MPARSSLAAAIYGGEDPQYAPAHSLSEAAQYLRLPGATIRSWTVGRTYPTEAGPRVFRPLIAIADPEHRLLSFHDLVELHVLSSIRRVRRIELRAVRRAMDFLRKRLKSRHPLLDRAMLTNGQVLLIEQYGQLVNLSQDGQLEMKQLLTAYLKRIDRDRQGIPIRLFPFTRHRIEESPRLVSIDPAIRFGKPCITGTGIPTAIIADRYEAGDSIALLAGDYGRTTEEIEEAIRYESRAAS